MTAPRGRLLRLCQKELRETLRDRRTIVTLVLMPLLVYPILSMTLNRFLLEAGAPGAAEIVIGVPDQREGDALREILADPRSQPPPVIAEAAGGEVAQFRFVAPTGGNSLEQGLRDRLYDVIVRWVGPEPARVLVLARENDQTSLAARRVLVQRLMYFNQERVREVAEAVGTPVPPPVAVAVGTIGGEGQGSLLASIIPLVLVLMTITGAVYPAIDLTAGERERGTMEALIASPVPRWALLFAKYVAVVTVALLTALANLVAMFVTLWAGGLMPLLVGPGEPFPWLQFLQILGLLVLFSGFFSAVLLALTSFARSFKEAQAYLIPLMLISLAPGVMSLMPGVEFAGAIAIVPLLNIILLSREILGGTADAAPTLAAVLSTVCYAGAALKVASKLFGGDAVLRGSELSVGAALRRPESKRMRPTVSEAAMTLALLFPVYYLASNALSRGAEMPIAVRLVLNALVLIAVFGGLPLAAALYCRDALKTTYRVRRPRFLAVVGGVVMGLGLWAWAHELFVLAEMLGMEGLDASRIRRVEAMLEQFRQTSPLLILATLALTPAVIEEFCFRGYLFSALRGRLNPAETIVVTAVLFGLFHVLTGSVLLVERFLPTAMLGVFLGWVAWRSGSVWPSIFLHLTHNGLLEMVAVYQDQLQEMGIGVEQQTHLPVAWLVGCSMAVIVGAGLVWLGRREEGPPAAAD